MRIDEKKENYRDRADAVAGSTNDRSNVGIRAFVWDVIDSY